MKKKLIILFTLLVILVCALSITSMCFAEEENASEDVVIEAQEEDVLTADNDAWTWLKETWARLKEVIGVSLSAIIGAIVIVAVKYITNKGFEKFDKANNPNAIAKDIKDGVLEGISNSALDVNMKPLMASQYREMSEQVYADLKKENELLKKMVYASVDCIEKLGAYFDCSVAVGDEAKQEFKDTIANAKALFNEPTQEVKATIEVVAEPTKETSKKVAQHY